jgi:hypothetical protein
VRALFAAEEPGVSIVETEVRTRADAPSGVPKTARAESSAGKPSLDAESLEVAARTYPLPEGRAQPDTAIDDPGHGDDVQKRVEPDVTPIEAAVLRAPLEPAAVAATPASPVPASPSAPFEAPRATREAAAVARAEPPPVRVHIGRLEVRANVEEPRAQPPRRESARPVELSLADYLRGTREAG